MSDGGASTGLLTQKLKSRDWGRIAVRLVRLAVKFVVQNDRDFLDVILLYLPNMTKCSILLALLLGYVFCVSALAFITSEFYVFDVLLLSLSWYVTICNILSFPYLLTPCSRVLLEKLTGFQLVKKFPAFYGTRKFITAFTSAPPYLSLS